MPVCSCWTLDETIGGIDEFGYVIFEKNVPFMMTVSEMEASIHLLEKAKTAANGYNRDVTLCGHTATMSKDTTGLKPLRKKNITWDRYEDFTLRIKKLDKVVATTIAENGLCVNCWHLMQTIPSSAIFG